MLLENLESRRLMSVSLDPASKLLTVTGTNEADVISANVQNKQLKVTDNGVTRTYALSAVKKIAVYAKAGADAVTIDPSVFLPTFIDTGVGHPTGGLGDEVRGGSGPDTVHVYSFLADVFAGAGDDRLVNYGTQNSLYGEAGNDTFVSRAQGGGVSDSGYVGGAGGDTMDYSAATKGLLIRTNGAGEYVPGTGIPPFVPGFARDAVAGMENLYGGSGDDFVFGDAAHNVLRGNGGNDYVRGGGGDDKLYGGADADALFGDDGNDYVEGNDGHDFLSAGAGTDALHGGNGDDVFYSRDGAKDFVSGGAGHDKAARDAVDVLNSVEGTA